MTYSDVLKSNGIKKQSFIKLETIELEIDINNVVPVVNLQFINV